MQSVLRLTAALCVVALLQGCIIKVNADGDHDRYDDDSRGDVSRVFGGITVDEGQTAGDIESVNGSIRLNDGAIAEDVETVNGSIRAGRDVTAESLETVNGSIKAGRGLAVDGSVETVNGRIELRDASRVSGDVETVNGAIELDGVQVSGSVETTNGDISLERGTVVEENVVFSESNGWWQNNNDMPTLFVDASSEVRGDIVLYRPVRIEIEDGARVGDIDRRYDDKYERDRRDW